MSHNKEVYLVENDRPKNNVVRSPLWVRVIKSWARHISVGKLTIEFPNKERFVVEGAMHGPNATLTIKSPKFVWQVLSGGQLGLARAYMDDNCSSPDIGALLDLGLANESHLSSVLSLPYISKIITNFKHKRRANTKTGSKRNIAFHYDLGNEFYGHWLDETMTYSSALFDNQEQSLPDAQTNKYARIVEKLNITHDDRVLEIGCGWGGFAEYAARETGCTIVCLTLSQEQANFAKKRIEAAGLSQQVEIRIEDYRNCQGQFDKVVSIEMFEAVGEENWPIYFEKLRTLLRKNGEALLQVITIDDAILDDYRNNADFIQTYIFPGGMLPSVEALFDVANRYHFTLEDKLMFGRDYEKTLLLWDNDFVNQWESIKPLGFDERFYRMWRWYFHYCSAGFRDGRIDVGQFHFKSN